MKKKIALSLIAAMGGMVSYASFGEVYYWAGGDWGLYSEPSNWRLGDADGAVAASCPDESDSLYSRQDFRFDLGGGDCSVGSWNTTDDWKGDALSISNGTLTVGTIITHNGMVEVCSGGTLAVNTRYVLALNDAGAHEVYVRDGGELQMLGDAVVYKMVMSVESGGRLLFNPSRFGPSPGTCQNSTLTVRGEMVAPNGFQFVHDDFGAAANHLTLSLLDGGTLKTGGGISRGVGRTGALKFVWSGGTIVADGNVDFVNTECSIPENAELALNAAEGCRIDLSPFAVDAGVALEKTGAGSVRFGTNNFAMASVTIAEGSLSVGEAYPSVGSVVLKDGTSVMLDCAASDIVFPSDVGVEDGAEVSLKIAAGGISVNTLPAAFTDVLFDLSSAATGVPFITCTDAASRETLRERLASALPATQEVYEDGDALVILEKKDCTFTGGVDGTVTDWSDPAGWSGGVVPTSGEVAVSGEGVTLDISSTPSVGRMEVSRGATIRVSGDGVELPETALMGSARLEIVSGSVCLTNGFSCSAAIAGGSVSLPALVVNAGATLNVAAGMKFRNVAVELYGTMAKQGTDGEGLTIGYADADETSYVSFVGDGGTFDVHSNQRQENGKVDFVCPAAGGRVKVLGDIVLKDAAFNVNGWADFGFRRFGVNSPGSERFTVVLDGTHIAAPWSFIAAGGVRIALKNGGSILKNRSCANHGFDNELRDDAKVEVVGAGSYFDYAGGYNDFRVKSTDAGSMTVRDGGAYVVGYSAGDGKGAFVSSNGILGVAKQYGARHRSELLKGFGYVRIEPESALFVCPLDLGVGNADWERRSVFSDIPFAGGGDLVISNSMPTKAFTVTVVNGTNVCSGLAMAVAPEGDDVAETVLYFADGANWAGTVVANGHVALTNIAAAAQPANVSFSRVRLVDRMPLRVYRSADGDAVSDTIFVDGGFALETGDAGVVDVVPQAGFTLMETDAITLGTYPRNAFAGVKVRCGKRRLSVRELAAEQDGMAVCVARPAGNFTVTVR